MTLPVACPLASCTPSPDPPTVPQRKRRRRAPASGASDDCFACTKRNTKCDRRRPYCSQCLEVGKECSGYKTQLTWGVGVASRGKLRGLSLPVARSAPAARSPRSQRQRPTSAASKSYDSGDEETKVKVETPGSVTSDPYSNFDFVNMAPHVVSGPIPVTDWNLNVTHDFALHDYHQDSLSPQKQLPQLHRLHTLSLGRADTNILSSSLDSVSVYTDSDYGSPASHTLDDVPFLHSPTPMYSTFSSRNSLTDSPVAPVLGSTRGPTSCPTSCPENYYPQSDMSSSMTSHQNLYDITEARQHQSSPIPEGVFFDDDMLAGPSGVHGSDFISNVLGARSAHFGWSHVTDDDAISQTASESDAYHMSSYDPLSSSFTSEITPRISFFLDYYEKIICPSVVVLDSPSNPYREHILSLAKVSRSLQHAICALSACNLRMKRKQSLGQDRYRTPLEVEMADRVSGRMSRPTPSRSFSHLSLSPELQSTDSSLQEEFQHRTLAVSLLNQQLSDPATARHDCVLATLFILCHYRMCESGIAQFRTQFAGVKKILGMREAGMETGSWGWMETLFTYFDGIAASINDREAQLRGGYLDMIATPLNPNHGLENLAGCDSMLFKIIGRLGRLNMLSQHRQVDTGDAPNAARRAVPPRPRPELAGQALVDFYTHHSHNFDGNGFASTLDDDASLSQLTGLSSHDDLRTTFWTEWKATRLALQEWEFDAARLMAILPVSPTANQVRDFSYLSEAFRYSALLYTERLASPNLPSSHLNFQNLVSQVLYYVTSLEKGSGCEKFLLWPLFITGSECVNELQQSIVRGKCREIMGRSGYLNNLAGLEVLEKVWQERESGDMHPNIHGGPFRWTKYMESSEGEWIMF